MGIAKDRINLDLQVSSELNDKLDEIARVSGTTKTDVIRQALALTMIAHTAKTEGRHIGLVTDPSKLDTELVGVI